MEPAGDIAKAILEGFDRHYRIFRKMCAEAQGRFERADWAAVRAAHGERIDLYDARVREAVDTISTRFPRARVDESVWPQVKRAYIELLYDHHQPELAETFFNSVACRVLERTYYRNEYIFWRPAVSSEFIEGDAPAYRCYHPATQGFRRTLAAIVADARLSLPFEDLQRDLRCVVRALRSEFPAPRESHPDLQVQVLSSLFYRGEAAYIVGRIINGGREYPFAVPVRHGAANGTLVLDTLLVGSARLDVLFSLARSYFMVDMDVPSAYVAFLRRLMPARSAAELYTAVGLQKQGKTLFYRDLQGHLTHATDRFVEAPGVRGLVMVVFTLPSFPCVFKLMRDTFGAPKQSTHDDVRRQYQLVKHRDRVGRMADTLEFSDVAFPLARFDAALLAELESACASTVQRDGDRLIVKHLYIEARVTPLDIYLRGADEARARHGIGEYGRAIRELAAAGIFPGDLFCKNFGVTQSGRVVFYDYDEVALLGELHFREFVAARDELDELSAEPWYSVGPSDVFPAEWPKFLFAPGRDRELFMKDFPELTTARWWTERQEDLRRGVVPDVLPYPTEMRFSSAVTARQSALAAPTSSG
ncbi:MAG: bifunctional isocitrate dehydrogenase kinase/phosphatase [Gemmatimonadaceae bacterium]